MNPGGLVVLPGTGEHRNAAQHVDQAGGNIIRHGKDPNSPDAGHLSLDGIQVVNRHCTRCEWEAQLVERGLGEDPLCPWCYGPTERTSVVGLVVESLRPGQKNPYAVSLGRLGGLKGGPARAAKLTAKRRRDIAAKAAKARWAAKKAKPAKAPKPGKSARNKRRGDFQSRQGD